MESLRTVANTLQAALDTGDKKQLQKCVIMLEEYLDGDAPVPTAPFTVAQLVEDLQQYAGAKRVLVKLPTKDGGNIQLQLVTRSNALYSSYRSLIRHLRTALLPDIPFKVVRTDLPNGYEGLCSRGTDGKFTIRVDKSLSERSAIDVLLHEISHILSWGKGNDMHGPHWGEAYSIVYREFLNWNNEQRRRHMAESTQNQN